MSSWDAPYPTERLVRYDDAWPAMAAGLAVDLSGVLGSRSVVEHVGSTSVPGLSAKPVIDLAVRVPTGWTPDGVDWAFAPLQRHGWSDVAAVGGHRAAVLVRAGVRVAVAHLFPENASLATQLVPGQEGWDDAHVRLFPDWLRRHPADRDAYAALKTELVTKGVWGSAYTAAKGPFVQAIVNQARAERGLPPVELPL